MTHAAMERLRGPKWVQELRREGLARFEQQGFPTSRLEEWKNTDVSPIARTVFEPAPDDPILPAAAELPNAARLNLGGARLFFLDGRHVPGLSSQVTLPPGVWVGSLAAAFDTMPERIRPHLLRRRPAAISAFEALNAAGLDDGAVVLIPENTRIEQPIEVIYAASGASRATAAHPRTLLIVGRASEARVVESYVGLGGGAYLTNAVTETVVEDNASLEHYRVQLEGPGAFHVSTSVSSQNRSSRYASHNLNLGGRLVRNDVQAVLNGEGADCKLYGLYLTRDSQHVDNHTVIDHAQPHGDSRELYKGILNDRSRTVFNGRILVRRGAQKTDAKQSNPNLVLSDGALAHTRPQLEIYADDVKCTHGATIGRLDEDAVFYLRSRGLAAGEARNLLIHAFAGEVLDLIAIDPLRTHLSSAIAELLPASGR